MATKAKKIVKKKVSSKKLREADYFEQLNNKLDLVIDTMVIRDEFLSFKRETEVSFKEMRHMLDGLMTATDKLRKAVDDQTMEYVAVKKQLGRHERWIKEIAAQAGVKLSKE